MSFLVLLLHLYFEDEYQVSIVGYQTRKLTKQISLIIFENINLHAVNAGEYISLYKSTYV